MVKRKLYTVLGACACLLMLGQSRCGIKAGIGFSGGKYCVETDYSRTNYSPMPSAQVGFFYQNTFKSQFVIGAELNVNQFNSKEHFTAGDAMQGDCIPFMAYKSQDITTRRYSSALQPMLNVGYSYKRFTGTAGLGCNYFVFNKYDSKGSSVDYMGNTYSNNNMSRQFTFSMPSVSNFTYGIRFGGGYMLNNNMSLGVSYSKYNGHKSNQVLAEMRYFIR